MTKKVKIPVPEELYQLASEYESPEDQRTVAPITQQAAKSLLKRAPQILPVSSINHIMQCLRHHEKYTFSGKVRFLMRTQKSRRFLVKYVKVLAKVLSENYWIKSISKKHALYALCPQLSDIFNAVTAINRASKALNRLHTALHGEFDEEFFGGTKFVEKYEQRIGTFRGIKYASKK